MTRKVILIAALFPVVAMIVASADVLAKAYIYPNKGQTPEQQQKDEFECYTWARQQTGFDPMQQPRASSPPPQREAPKGGVARGAVRGGLTGLAVGKIAGDSNKGWKVGAVGGGLIGGMRRRDQVRKQQHAEQQWAQEQAAQYRRARNEYDRAHAACLGARGYTVR
jgi:hypothetical protein